MGAVWDSALPHNLKFVLLSYAEAVAIERRWKRNGHHESRCPICRGLA